MTNRRNFIKQITAAGIASSIPSVLFAQHASAKSIQLLVRGDDMGKDYGRTKGFMKAHKEGILTSASIMATSIYFNESVQFCKENPTLAAGIHITILDGTQRPVLSPDEVPSLVNPKGFFYENINQLNNANPKIEEIEKEIRAQIEKVRASGLHFVYLDWHRYGGAETRVGKIRKEVTIKLCQEKQLIFGQDCKYNDGSMYGYVRKSLVPESWPKQRLPDGQEVYYPATALSKEDQQLFFDRLTNLKPGKWTEVVHPGLAEPERTSVTELLCSPKTKEIIKMKNIQLISYYNLWEDEYGKLR